MPFSVRSLAGPLRRAGLVLARLLRDYPATERRIAIVVVDARGHVLLICRRSGDWQLPTARPLGRMESVVRRKLRSDAGLEVDRRSVQYVCFLEEQYPYVKRRLTVAVVQIEVKAPRPHPRAARALDWRAPERVTGLDRMQQAAIDRARTLLEDRAPR